MTVSLIPSTELAPVASSDVDRALLDPTMTDIRPSVLNEIKTLQGLGVDVELVDTHDPYALSAERQVALDARVEELEAAEDGATQFRSPYGLSIWSKLTKRAIALCTLYNPEAQTLGEGIDTAVYDEPLFTIPNVPVKVSATQIMQAVYGPEKAQGWIDSYTAFVPAVIEDDQAEVLSSRDFFKGVKDAEGVRTRAITAMEMVAEHVASRPLLAERDDLVSASLACGAAGPVYQMVEGLEARGHGFSKVVLFDQDPMALGTAVSLARNEGIEDKIVVHLGDLSNPDELLKSFEPHSVDVVDLLGLFEYFPEANAIELLQNVKKIMRPGGIIVFGNMLDDRPQQTFFSKVVKWPRLQQRKIQQVIDIVTQGGYSSDDLSVRVPNEGVYAVYGLRVPELAVVEEIEDTETSNRASDDVVAGIGATVLPRY